MFKAILIEKDDAGYRAAMRDGTMPNCLRGCDRAGEPFHPQPQGRAGHHGQRAGGAQSLMVPGIDLAGWWSTVRIPHISRAMLCCSMAGVGEVHWGGLAQKARLNGDWLIPLPGAFTPQQAMAIGTAGYTAMLCVLALEKQVRPADGEILVTGAAGA